MFVSHAVVISVGLIYLLLTSLLEILSDVAFGDWIGIEEEIKNL